MSTVVKDLGAVSAYAYAVEKGYTGTEAEFAELMADYAEVGQRAEDAADSALESKTAAQTAATTATTKASEATTAAQTATTKAAEASTSASTATTAKDDAVAAKTAAETAQGKAEDAQAAAESVAESIPSDYSQLSEDVSQLKEDFTYTYDGVMQIDTSDTASAYPSTTIGTAISFSYSAKSTTIKKIVAVKQGYTYKVAVVNSASPSSTANRNSVVADTNLIVRQIIITGTTADETFVTEFTAVCDGWFYLCVDANYVNVTINGGVGYSGYIGVAKANERIDVIRDLAPIGDVMTLKIGYWKNSTTFSTTVNYRVGANAITFDKDVVISAYNGYVFMGYLDSVYFEPIDHKIIPANTELKLSIRKVWENSSETVTVADLADKVYIMNWNPLTDYNLLKDTFTGIEMFKTAGFIGDSYTAVRLGHSWVTIAGNITGVTTTIYAKSGDDSGAWITDTVNGLPILLADTAKELYWIALGINDGDRVDSNASYLGSISDISGDYASYPDTFYGNYGHIIEAIQAHAPNAKIVLYKPIFKSVSRTLYGVSSTKNGIKQVRDAIGEIAEHYSLPCMDALDEVFFHTPLYASRMDWDTGAGTHPSRMLYAGIAKANLRLMSKCIFDNQAYFMGLT